MDNKKCANELKKIAQESAKLPIDCSDDDLEIVVVGSAKPTLATRKSDAMDYWLGRVKHRTKENCIIVDQPDSQGVVNQPLKAAAAIKPAISIYSHQKQKDQQKRGREVINVEQANAKMNIEKYKNSLFGAEKKAPEKQWVESQQSKKKRFERQIEIIESMNQPRWKEEKQRTEERNRYKYPVSSAATYGFDHHPNTRGFDSFNQATWNDYERNRKIESDKREKKRKEQLQKDKAREEELKQQKAREAEAHFLEFACGMFGKKKLKDEVSDAALEESAAKAGTPPDQEKEPDGSQKIIAGKAEEESLEAEAELQAGEVEAGEVDAKAEEEAEQEDAEVMEAMEPRAPRYGIKDIIKVHYCPYSSEVVKEVLEHNYAQDMPNYETKKIPDIFDSDYQPYNRIFHKLIANESIADVAHRMRQVEKNENSNPLKVTISQSLKPSFDGRTELLMKEVSPAGEKVNHLRGFSLSRLRIGLLTNQVEYRRHHYGISADGESFGVLLVLVTPESKDEMEWVKALGRFPLHELEMVFLKKGSRDAYFHDLEKLTTSSREYQAITHMRYSELAPVILDPRLMDRQMGAYVPRKDSLNDILDKLKAIFNQTQYESIREMVLRERGIVMLQGPPGTGKTSTLMGLLSAQYEYLKRNGDNRKIMICAPSNAAVDHIVRRLLTEGLFNGDGEIIYPNALRVGIVETLDERVRSVSLDDLCEKKIIEQQARADEQRRLTTPQIKTKIIEVQKQLRRLSGKSNEKEYLQLKQEEIRYENMLLAFRTEKVVTARKHYSYYESQFLANADIILTTLSSSGNERLDQLRGEIACLIIDEAAQATEPNLLIALQTGVQKVLLIGDPYQLPATCMSSDCNLTLFNRSLFERFLDAGIKPYFLNIQYRMAPLIRAFPSRRFYHNRLVDAASVAERPMLPFLVDFHNRNMVFLDVKYGREALRGNSYMNESEGKTVGKLVRCLLWEDISLGIITPYQAQRTVITRECKQELRDMPQDLPNFEKNVMINTVDSFQGQERDIIIVSTVRANARQHLGFLTDERRINVTLTRSKYLLIIVGHGDTLGSNEVWNDFLETAESQKVYYELNNPIELTDVLKNVLQRHSESRVERRRHSQLTTDIRHKERKEMEFSDIKRKAYEKIAKTPIPERRPSHDEQPARPPATDPPLPPANHQNKYALDIKESEKIREEKRLKEKEVEEFEAMNSRMRKKEEELKNHKDYGQLFNF